MCDAEGEVRRARPRERGDTHMRLRAQLTHAVKGERREMKLLSKTQGERISCTFPLSLSLDKRHRGQERDEEREEEMKRER